MSTVLVLVHLPTLAWECSIEELFFLGMYHADFRGPSFLLNSDFKMDRGMIMMIDFPWFEDNEFNALMISDPQIRFHLQDPWISMDFDGFSESQILGSPEVREVQVRRALVETRRRWQFLDPCALEPKSDSLEVLMKTCLKRNLNVFFAHRIT